MRNKKLVRGSTMTVEIAQELANVEEDREELEAPPICNIISRRKRKNQSPQNLLPWFIRREKDN